jgi:hypothetical protein
MKPRLIALLVACTVALGLAASPAWGQQAQLVGQLALTGQQAAASALAGQNAVNANVPVSIAGGSINAGASSANQDANNAADAEAGNESGTLQVADATQTGGSSSCRAGCGGAGQFQAVLQDAKTKQDADAKANADQNAVNANVPVSIAGGDVNAGDSSADQDANNSADAEAGNESKTVQLAAAEQTGGSSSCKWGCGGDGQFQAIGQLAVTSQEADADADADQNAVNGNAPVAIAGGDVNAGDSSAAQDADNSADAEAGNESKTVQLAEAEQTGGGHDRCKGTDKCDPCKDTCHKPCEKGCGGDGQFQAIGQLALTSQEADADADADQNAVNGNAPVAIAGGDVNAGDSSADQDADNSADAEAGNESKTVQLAEAEQAGGGSCRERCYDPCEYTCRKPCEKGCGGHGQFQALKQLAFTFQEADADADADQNVVNGNAPVAIAGGDVNAGDSSAEQDADNWADAEAENWGFSVQLAAARQSPW